MKKTCKIAAMILAIILALSLRVPLANADEYGRPDCYGTAEYPQKYGKIGSDINVSSLSDSLVIKLTSDKKTLTDGRIRFTLSVTGGQENVEISALGIIPVYNVKLFDAVTTEQAAAGTRSLDGKILLSPEPVIQSSKWTSNMNAYTVAAAWGSDEPVVIPAGEKLAFYEFALDPKEPSAETPEPTETPGPTDTPEPTAEPTAEPTTEPTAEPTAEPTPEPTAEPTTEPTTEPTAEPTYEPTAEPTAEPTQEPTTEPSAELTAEPTAEATTEPTAEPTAESTAEPESSAETESGETSVPDMGAGRKETVVYKPDPASAGKSLDNSVETVVYAYVTFKKGELEFSRLVSVAIGGENRIILSANVSIKDTLSLKVKANVPEGVDDPVMRFVMENREPETVQGVKIGGLWQFELGGIGFDRMTDKIDLALYDGTEILDSRTGFSVKAYAEAVINGNFSDSAKTAAGRLLMYGAEVQKTLAYKTEELPTDGVDALSDGTLFPEIAKAPGSRMEIVSSDDEGEIFNVGFTFSGGYEFFFKTAGIMEGARVYYLDNEAFGPEMTVVRTDYGAIVYAGRILIQDVGRTVVFENGPDNYVKIRCVDVISGYWNNKTEGAVARALFGLYSALEEYKAS
ncbi:MAG: PT domain-containing protein [Clostridia bacterium]|nr:PT domain-containing protein [Clostridia bacterium]